MVITVKIAQEIISHEAIVREAYKDTVGVWTWGIGITNASGHNVHPEYLDRPQPLSVCLAVFVDLLRTAYAPAVKQVFADHRLAEHQFGAALSFHYNTGGIATATWAELWKAGDVAGARDAFMNWSKPAAIIPRRQRERDLFFDAVWSSDGLATEYPVLRPSYSPDVSAGKSIDITAALTDLIDGT